MDSDVKLWDSRPRSITPLLTAAVLDFVLKLLLFSHLSVINKEKINISVTALYFTDTTVANTNNCFISLVRSNYVNDIWTTTKLHWPSVVMEVTARGYLNLQQVQKRELVNLMHIFFFLLPRATYSPIRQLQFHASSIRHDTVHDLRFVEMTVACLLLTRTFLTTYF